MKKKYNILILSNIKDIDAKEDEYIANSFEEDGHNALIKWVDFDEKLDDEFDIILRRNTWVQEKENTFIYEKYNEIMNRRIKNKPIKKINFYEIDSDGKNYLINYYKNGLPVIPSSNNLEEASSWGEYKEYVLKPLNSLGSGFGQIIVSKDDLKNKFKEGMLIQPKLNFKSEVQCYFVANELMYTFEFIPSKYPDYPMPTIIELTEKEREIVYKFVKEANVKVGFLRIDFLRLDNNKLILLEIEASSPFMGLKIIDKELRNKVINKYKQNIYKYLEKNL